MERMSLYFCCSLYLLGMLHITRAYTYGTEGHLEYSNVVSAEQKAQDMQPMPGAVRPWTGDSEFMKNPAVRRPYHVFPMFQHAPVPLADMQLFRPVSGRRQLPNRVTSLLIPQMKPQRIQVSPARNARGVEMMKGQIMYSNTLHYTPAEPPGTVIRAVPLTLNIQCLYNRFHYSYKMGFLPVARARLFHKIFERRAKFNLYVCNERWERLEGNRSFVLGEPMYFEVSTAYTSEDERIFVDSCYATASTDPKSIPQHNVICNYGCMEDSRRQGSLSRFLQRQSNIIRFSVDAFLLPHVTGMHFYLHCTVSVHSATTSAIAKSCTYNNVETRWEELYTDASVCACCDSTCEIESTSSLPHVTQSITSKPWILDQNEQSLINTMEGWVKVQEDREEVKFKSAEVIGEDDYTVEIVTDTEDQIEAKEKYKKMPMKEKFLEDVNDDQVSSKSGAQEMIRITRKELSEDKIQPEDSEKNMHVQSTPPPQMVMDEEIFLSAKHEPVGWNQDEHN